MNLSDCYIARVKSFLGLRSIDPPVVFDEFLKKNLKNLMALIEKNQIIVIDENGNEVDSLLWKKYIIDFYDDNYIEKFNFGEDESFFESNTKDDKFQLEHNQGELAEAKLLRKIEIEEKAENEKDADSEKTIFDEDDSFSEANTDDYKFDLEKNQGELQNIEPLSKREVEEKTEIEPQNDVDIDSDKTILEEDDSPVESDTIESNDKSHLEKKQGELEEVESISKIDVEEKAEIAQENDTDLDKTILDEDDSFVETNTIDIWDKSLLEKNQGEFTEAEPLSKIDIEEKTETADENDADFDANSDANSDKTILNEVDSHVENNAIEIDDEFQIEQIQGEFEEIELLSKIDIQEKAKIEHKNRLLKSLKECDDEYKVIVQRGIESTNKKIEELQSKRESLLISINKKSKEFSRRNN